MSAPVIDDRTTGRDYPLPHPTNPIKADAVRIREAVQKVDEDVVAAQRETRRRWVHRFIGLNI